MERNLIWRKKTHKKHKENNIFWQWKYKIEIVSANLLAGEGYDALNVSDGFSGNGQDPGWKNLGLPSIIDNWFFSYIFN